MSSYLLLGGPSHAEIVEVPQGGTILRPAAPNLEDLLAGRTEPSTQGAQVEYRQWSLGDRIGSKFSGFKLMVAGGTSDEQAVLLFRDMVQRYYDRPRQSLPQQEAGLVDLLSALEAFLAASPDGAG